jgi:hypothetical protein
MTSTVTKMTYRELTDELQNRPPRERSVGYLTALREERDRRDEEIRLGSVSPDQRQILDLISDDERSLIRLESIVAARELALDEAEADHARVQTHKRELEAQLAVLRGEAAEAFELHRERRERERGGVAWKE